MCISLHSLVCLPCLEANRLPGPARPSMQSCMYQQQHRSLLGVHIAEKPCHLRRHPSDRSEGRLNKVASFAQQPFRTPPPSFPTAPLSAMRISLVCPPSLEANRLPGPARASIQSCTQQQQQQQSRSLLRVPIAEECCHGKNQVLPDGMPCGSRPGQPY